MKNWKNIVYNRILQHIGLASRARKTVTGEMLFTKIRQKDVYFVIIASDASANSQKKISDKCKYYAIPYSIYSTTAEISKAMGKHNRVAIGITEKNFAATIQKEIGG